tara:strand:- start:1506 stop:1637 length:132 start_codon:yes stop_codon:yes gene_type:complete
VENILVLAFDTNDAITIRRTEAISDGVNQSKLFINTCSISSAK